MSRIRAIWLVVGLLVTGPAAAARGADGAGRFVKDVLGREIIGPRQALADTVHFADSIIPRMPEVRTVAGWGRIADRMRCDALHYVIYRGAAAAWRDAKAGVDWLETIAGGPGYRIKKLRFEALPGL